MNQTKIFYEKRKVVRAKQTNASNAVALKDLRLKCQELSALLEAEKMKMNIASEKLHEHELLVRKTKCQEDTIYSLTQDLENYRRKVTPAISADGPQRLGANGSNEDESKVFNSNIALPLCNYIYGYDEFYLSYNIAFR